MTLDSLRKEAKRWLNALRTKDAAAWARIRKAYPKLKKEPVLRDVQHALACERGFENWIALRRAVEEPLEQLALDYVSGFEGDEAALGRLNAFYQREFKVEDLRAEIWARVYAHRQRSSKVAKNYLRLEEARIVVAQNAGHSSWGAFRKAAAAGEARSRDFYELDEGEGRIAPRRRLSAAEWEDLAAIAEERGIGAIDAHGLMTDGALERIARIGGVKRLNLSGCRELTDRSLKALAGMPQLEELDVSGYPGGVLTDAGLAVLRELPNLRKFQMCWQAGTTDEGASHLRHCEKLESVNVMGSPTGDGVIAAMAGKKKLRELRCGRLVTDAGLVGLGEIPRLRRRDGGVTLLIDGPFSDGGLAAVARLKGLRELDLFWHVTGISSAAFAHLRDLAGLETLGCDGKLATDEALAHIGAMPGLRNLRIQGAEAGDDGFAALARSKSLEKVWGRDCEGFGDRGFRAFSRMPSLSNLGMNLAKVSGTALGRLRAFPRLTELTPIGLTDEGFRQVAKAKGIERLVCMYCRETTDAATESIAGLKLKFYYAGLTRITDRSLEILGGMAALEEIEFYECQGVTDAGMAALAGLPRLRRIEAAGCPGVTLGGMSVFPKRVRAKWRP